MAHQTKVYIYQLQLPYYRINLGHKIFEEYFQSLWISIFKLSYISFIYFEGTVLRALFGMKLCTEMNQLTTPYNKLSNYLWWRRCGFITKIKTFNFGLCFPMLVHANFLLFYRECIIRFFTVASILIHQEEFIDPQLMAINFFCNHYNLDKECLTFIIVS